MHFKTFGALTGTPEALKKMITRKDCEVKELTPGEPLVLCIVCWKKEMSGSGVGVERCSGVMKVLDSPEVCRSL